MKLPFQKKILGNIALFDFPQKLQLLGRIFQKLKTLELDTYLFMYT